MTCVIFPFALASEASTLDCTAVSKVCDQWLWWRGKPSASRIWSQRCKRVNWMQHLSTRIFTDSLGQSIEDAWILSAAAFPASRSVQPVCVKRPKILDTCGPSSSQGLLFSDLGLASSRMLMGSSTHQVRDTIPFSTMSSATWNIWVSDRRQAASQRQNLAHHTSENDGSSSVLPPMIWPTPTTAEAEKISNCPNYGQKALGNHPILVGHPQRPKNLTKDIAGRPAQAKPNTNGKQGVLLNAAWVDQLMGFPENWSNVQIEETD